MTEQEQEQEQEAGVADEVRRLGAKYADRHAELLRRLGE